MFCLLKNIKQLNIYFKYYLSPRSTALKVLNKNVNIQLSKSKYTIEAILLLGTGV